MSEKEKDYSDYIQHTSTISNSLSLLSGFTFTTTTVILTLLPEPSLFLAQAALFLLIFVFSMLGFLIKWTDKISLSHCRNLPKIEKGSANVFNLLFFVSDILFGVVILIMFLLFNLLYLTLASAVVQAFFIILSYMIIWKSVFELRKNPPSNSEIRTHPKS